MIEQAVSGLVLSINEKAASRADSALNLLRNAAMEVLSRNGTGRRYKRHVASAPGQPPAPDKGNLRRNWQGSKQISGSGAGKGIRITLRIRSRMHYADYLEYGTRKMAARPYHERIKERAKPPIRALYSEL